MTVPAYAELAVTTNFSFLRGASHPGEFVARAEDLAYAAIGIADRNTLAGVVRAHDAWKRLNPGTPPRLLVGARLVFRDATPDILAYPQDRKAYARLSRLLSVGKLRAPKGECFLDFKDLLEYRRGLLLIVMPDSCPPLSTTRASPLVDISPRQGFACGGRSPSLPISLPHLAMTHGWRRPCSIPARIAAAWTICGNWPARHVCR